jgi:hypothetical protein
MRWRRSWIRPTKLLWSATFATVAFAVAPADAAAVRLAANTDGASTTTTTVSTTMTTTTTLMPYWSSVLLGIFPAEPIHALELQIDVDQPHAAPACIYLIPDAVTVSNGYIEQRYDVPSNPDGSLMRSQAAIECSYRTESDEGPSSEENYVLNFVHAWINLDWVHRKPVATRICVLAFDADGNSPTRQSGCRYACGDAICNGGEPTVLDALIVLRSAVALSSCSAALCDTDTDGSVSASDAFRVLRRAVGIAQPLLCPPPDHCLTPLR